MKQILIYSESLTWGIIPNSRKRLPFDQRWPGVFENALLASGQRVRVIENCLNGRRTVWSDPFKPGRNGAEGLSQVIEMHAPLSLVILMLGSNDFQNTHDNDAWLSSQGMASLIQIVRQAPVEPGMPIPEIMVVAPPPIDAPKGGIASKFKGAETRCIGLPEALKSVAEDAGVFFFNAGDVTDTSAVDGIHLDAHQHQLLGKALASAVMDYLSGP